MKLLFVLQGLNEFCPRRDQFYKPFIFHVSRGNPSLSELDIDANTNKIAFSRRDAGDVGLLWIPYELKRL